MAWGLASAKAPCPGGRGGGQPVGLGGGVGGEGGGGSSDVLTPAWSRETHRVAGGGGGGGGGVSANTACCHGSALVWCEAKPVAWGLASAKAPCPGGRVGLGGGGQPASLGGGVGGGGGGGSSGVPTSAWSREAHCVAGGDDGVGGGAARWSMERVTLRAHPLGLGAPLAVCVRYCHCEGRADDLG